MNEFCKLQLSCPEDNHNKDYVIRREGNRVTVEYGRVSAKKQTRTYLSRSDEEAERLFLKKKEEKLAKGYRDVTRYTGMTLSDTAEIANKDMRDFMDEIIRYSNTFLRENLAESALGVSCLAIRDARTILDKIAGLDPSDPYLVCRANDLLTELFTVLPRKMKNVEDCMLASPDQMNILLEKQYDLLEAQEAGISTAGRGTDGKKTVLDRIGVSMRKVEDPKEIQYLRRLMDDNAGCESEKSWKYFDCAYRVSNRKTKEAFESYMRKNDYGPSDIHYLIHGSLNRNIYSLLEKGLTQRPASATFQGGLFGNGRYLANKGMKSIRYTSLGISGTMYNTESCGTGYLIVFRTAFHNPLVLKGDVTKEATHRYNANNIAPYDCVNAKRGTIYGYGSRLANDEYVIFHNEQLDPAYIIRLKN